MKRLFFGTIDTTGAASTAANQLLFEQFSSLFSGLITELRVYSLALGNYKIAIYVGNTIELATTLYTNETDNSSLLNDWSSVDLATPVEVNDSDNYYVSTNNSIVGVISRVANPLPVRWFTGQTYSSMTFPDPAGAGYVNGISSNLVSAYGYPIPSVANVDGDDTIMDGQTSVIVDGTDLDDDGAPEVWLCDENDLSSVTATKVQQTVNSYDDDTVNIDINKGILAYGTLYLFVVTSLDQTSASHAVTLYSSTNIQDLANNIISSTGNTGQMIGYTEPATAEELLSLDMYRFLLEPIRQADNTREGALFVKRFLQGPQELWQSTTSKIFALKDLMSVTNCPDEYLQYLKNIVGWTTDLDYITSKLDFDELRRLIAATPELWKLRGREETIVDLLTLVTGARCLMLNWFDYRWIIGETVLGEVHEGNDPWMIDNPGPPDYGENYSTLRIVDNGDLDRVLVKYLVNFMRAISERIEIVYTQFFDRFLIEGDDTQWETMEGTPSLVVENGYAALEDLAEYQSAIVVNEYAYDWKNYVAYWKLKATGNYFGALFYVIDEDNYYRYRIYVNPTSYGYSLTKTISGATSIIDEGYLSFNIYDDVWYGVRIQCSEEGATNRIKVYIDGSLVLNVTDSSLSKGTIGFLSDNGAAAKLDEAELFELPLETDLIDINT